MLKEKITVGISNRDHSNSKYIVYQANGFDFVLKSGKKIHCGIYSSDRNEKNKIIDTIVLFLGIPVQEVTESDAYPELLY